MLYQVQREAGLRQEKTNHNKDAPFHQNPIDRSDVVDDDSRGKKSKAGIF
jgi:hypothetical protein